MTMDKARLPAIVLSFMMVAVAAAACVENAPVNKAPVARIGSPATGATFDNGVNLTFDGTGSYDPEKKALTFVWSFGDNMTSTGNLTAHAYALPGNYTVTLEVSDGKKKGTDRAELVIKQANRAPIVRLSVANATVSNEELVEFNASATTDPDGDDLVFNWNFGDGTTGQGKVATHLYPSLGNYSVTLNVSDGKTASSALQAMTVYQANRAPAPVLKATPLVAFLNEPIGFDASATTDADNDTLSAAWDFGDGQDGTGLLASHSYAAIGNFTVTGVVSDGKAERTANLKVTVLPRTKILIDWNNTDYGYIVIPEVAVDGADLTVSVSSRGGASDGSASIEELAGGRFRAKSTVLPSKGATLTVTARYIGLEVASRTLTVYEGTALPGTDCTATVESTISSHTEQPDSEEWMNVTASGEVAVIGWHADYYLRIVNGTMENVNDAGEGELRAGRSDIYRGWFNQTFDYGVPGNLSFEIWGRGNSTTTNLSSGQVTERLYSEMIWKVFDRNATYMYQYLNGSQGWLNLTMKVDTLGIEDRANGDGAIFSCIKTLTNTTAEGTVAGPFGPIHFLMFSDSTSWAVRSNLYTNSTIYVEFVQNVYTVNDTTGVWTLMEDQSSSGSEYPDADQDGTYNPDIAPVSMDDAYEFHGLMPRELLVGDRISGTNRHGMGVVVEVVEGSTRELGGRTYDVVRVRSTYEHAGGNGAGSSDAWVVSSGNLTGLPLETSDIKSWTNESQTETSRSVMKVVEVRED